MNTGKNLTRGAIGILFTVLFLWAGEPWKEKPYSEWTAKEVQRLFEDSPWARPVPTAFERRDFAVVAEGQSPDAATPVTRTDKVKSFVIVQWASAMTVREGIVRARQLQGSYSQQDAAQFLSNPPPDYVVAVFGPDVKKFEGISEETLRQSAHLKIKETNRKIPAENVRIARQGSDLSAVEFHFPREMDGKPTISASAKKLEFKCPFAKESLTTTFDLRKMVRDRKPDL